MAQRFGKYKVSKKESELSLRDGGEIAGGLTVNGIDLTPNDLATTLLGLNPTWRLNFGGATLAAGSNTTDLHLIDKLTPVNTFVSFSICSSRDI